MFRRTFSGIMLSLLVMSTLALVFNIQPVETELAALTVPEESAAMQGTIDLASQEPPPIEWNKTYGGTDYDFANSVVQTGDGGYALAGDTQSYGAGGGDMLLVKTDVNGNLQWNKTYGGTGGDSANSVVQTGDGGYAIAGTTEPLGTSYCDFLLVKTDGNGNMQWSRTYGGLADDWAWSVVQTGDGGYAIAGTTRIVGHSDDFWLIKTDASGNMIWNKTYGGTDSNDFAYDMVQTSEGGYAIAGNAYGDGGAYLVKTDANGNMQWNKTYGASVILGLVQTSDGGYALTGYIYDVADLYLLKTDASGNEQWNVKYGGSDDDLAESVVQTNDGGYAITGYTESFGIMDFWLVKIAPSEGEPSDDCGWPVLVSPVQISSHAGYYVGDTLTASFTIQNQGTAAIHLDKLLFGGRFNGGTLPGGEFPDFTFRSVTLQVGQTYQYEGTLDLTDSGYYQFFVAYYIASPTEAEKQLLDSNNWNTCIDLAPGLTDSDRTWSRSILEWAPLPQTIPIVGKGTWITYIWTIEGGGDNLPAIIGRLRSAKVRWVAIKCGDSNAYWLREGGSLSQWADAYGGFDQVVKRFHDGGIRVIGAHFTYGRNIHSEFPDVSETDVSNRILDIEGIDGLLIDAEPDVDPQWNLDQWGEYAQRLEDYLENIRNIAHPGSFVAYTSYARSGGWKGELHELFTRYCDVCMPQAYWAARPQAPEEEIAEMEADLGALYDRWHNKPIMPMGQGGGIEVGRDIIPGEIGEFCDLLFAKGYFGMSLFSYEVMSENWEWTEYSGCFNPDTTISGQCPIELVVTDPDGLIISKTLNEVPGALYTESDPNGNNDTVIEVNILHKKLGDYFTTVIPKPDANLNDTYSLDFSSLNMTTTLAQNVSISDIPSESYAVTLTETTIVPRTAAHDIGIDQFSALKTIIGQDQVASLDVKVRNYGDDAEHFNITLYLNSSIIADLENITLASRDSFLTTFNWNTTGLPRGIYTIDAVCSCVEGENYTDDNLKSLSIGITIPGDVNGDFIVDIYDAIKLSGAYNSVPTSSNWNSNADINSDNIVDIYDAIILANHYNQHYP